MEHNAREMTVRKTLAIAKAQKGVLICLLANLIWPMFPPLLFVILPVQVYFVYRLTALVGIGVPVIWAVGTLIPFLNLLLLVLLAQASTKAIREAGFEVGFTGANVKAIQEACDREAQP